MEERVFVSILRRRTRQVLVGPVGIGGDARISVQSMTKTDTRDVEATLSQIRSLKDAGCDIVRCAVPDMEAAVALERSRKGLLCLLLQTSILITGLHLLPLMQVLTN